MPSAASIYETLGGTRVFRRRRSSVEELRQRIRRGLPYSAVEAVMDRFDLGRKEISEALDLPLRTLTRRKRERRLHPDESDRLVRLARIGAQAEEVLEGPEEASRWLRRPNRALGGRAPLELLDTDLGTRQVEEVLGRIEHGVYG